MIETEVETQIFETGTFVYTLKKVVPTKIYSVVSYVTGIETTFRQNVDYILDGNNIVWNQTTLGTKPDNYAEMTIVYDYEPIPTVIPFSEEQFGRDIKLNNYDILGANSGDLQLVNFSKNLLDALKNRLLTDKGEMFVNPAYGSELHKLLGMRINKTTTELAKLYVVDCVSQDPRVKEIYNVEIIPDETNRAITINVYFTPIIGRERLNLVFDYFLDYDNTEYE